MTEATKVLYDVSQAIKELNKLNSKVDEAGDKANNSFEKGNKSARKFDKLLARIPGTAGNVARGIASIGGGMAGLAAGAAAAAVSVGSVVAQFIDLDDVLRDSLKSIESFNRATDTIQNTRETISAIADAAINRDFRLAQRAASTRQGLVNLELNEVERVRDAAQERLSIFQEELRRRQGLLSDAVSREESLRERLNRRNVESTPFGGFDADLQAAKLNQAAREAAGRGDLDRAEALEKAAQRVAAEADNQAFALGDQQRTRDAINASIEEELDKTTEARNQIEDQVTAQQALVDAQKDSVNQALERLKVLRRTSRELRAQRRLLRNEGQEARETQQADSAARTIENNARDFVNNINNGGSSFKETVLDAASEFRKFLTDNPDRIAGVRLTQQAAGGAAQIEQLLQRAIRGQATASDFDAAAPALAELTDAVAKLQAAEGIDSFTKSQTRTLRRLESLLKSADSAFRGLEQFRDAGRSDSEFIRVGSAGITTEQANSLIKSLLKLNNTLSTPTRAEAVNNNQASSTGAPRAASAASSNVNVNATVKGGIIDEDVVQKITEIIRRELRKQTTQGVA